MSAPDGRSYEQPNVFVDVAMFTLDGEGRLSVLLVPRDKDPWKGALALPGGMVWTDKDDTLADTARRVLSLKAGVEAPYLEQLETFGGKFRDPDGWSASVVYYAVVPSKLLGDLPIEGSRLVPVDDVPGMPFDHGQMVGRALERIRGKASYSSLPTYLMGPTFTMSELRETYERVLGVRLDKVTFRRKMEALAFVEEAEGTGGTTRPAQLYRRVGDVLRTAGGAF
jgi:8-oxo-dGTP diphosphatase